MTTTVSPKDPIMQAFDALRDYEQAYNESADAGAKGDQTAAIYHFSNANYNANRAQVLATLAVAHELRLIRQTLRMGTNHD